jgi:hypothetical protein
MEFIKDYWWILVILLMVGVLMNVYKDLKRIDHKKFMDNKPDLPPHRDFNDKWDDDDVAEEKITVMRPRHREGARLHHHNDIVIARFCPA